MKEATYSIHAWNLMFVFQTFCDELRIRFEGVPE
jgi:hypothetical protein